MPSRVMPVPEGLDGERADLALAKLLGFSRTMAQTVLASGDARMDGRTLGKSDRVLAGAFLEVNWSDPEPVRVVETPVDGLDIVYLDEDIVVVDKPVGVVAHPATSWHGPTVLGALAARGISVSAFGPPERQGIVQRLDVGTSGLMVVARSDRAYSNLKRAFKERTVHKIYHALVQGQLDPLDGTIDAPIGRAPQHEWKFAVRADGRHAVTHYETMEAFRYASLARIHLETGRTHQIRVHMSSVRHPLAGDILYGADPTLARRLGLDRQWLHAVSLSFEHPGSGEWVEFRSEYPRDLAQALDTLAHL